MAIVTSSISSMEKATQYKHVFTCDVRHRHIYNTVTSVLWLPPAWHHSYTLSRGQQGCRELQHLLHCLVQL